MNTIQTGHMVSVEDAISKGRKMVNRPSLIVMTLTIVLSMVLAAMNIIPAWGIGASIIVAMLLAWLCWSVMITKWRLWAFENVRNVHELKKRAIQEKLIWPNNSMFEKTEIRSAANKARWESIKSKFGQKDVFNDDLSIPEETVIYYSKLMNYIEMSVMLVAVAAGVYLIVATDKRWLGAGLTAVCAWLAFKEYRQATNKKPQIIINNKGIQTISTSFHPWKDIRNDEVVTSYNGKNNTSYLKYHYPGGIEHLNIDDLDTDHTTLNKLLIFYRNRSKQRRN